MIKRRTNTKDKTNLPTLLKKNDLINYEAVFLEGYYRIKKV